MLLKIIGSIFYIFGLLLIFLEMGRYPVCEMGIEANCKDVAISFLHESGFGQFFLSFNTFVLVVLFLISVLIGAILVEISCKPSKVVSLTKLKGE